MFLETEYLHCFRRFFTKKGIKRFLCKKAGIFQCFLNSTHLTIIKFRYWYLLHYSLWKIQTELTYEYGNINSCLNWKPYFLLLKDIFKFSKPNDIDKYLGIYSIILWYFEVFFVVITNYSPYEVEKCSVPQMSHDWSCILRSNRRVTHIPFIR